MVRDIDFHVKHCTNKVYTLLRISAYSTLSGKLFENCPEKNYERLIYNVASLKKET